MIEIYVKYLLILTHRILFISGLKKWLHYSAMFSFFMITCSVLCIIYMFFLDPLSQYVYYAYLDLNCHIQSLVLADKKTTLS